jgi:pyruvate/2-oxoglutarate dehydrogenase complex dihydrolipoamide dehydrogenase (E3) component
VQLCAGGDRAVALAMELEADYRDLARVAHVHPTLAELVTDAAASI